MKITVAVIYGCSSVEHEVSIISAVQAMHSMDKEKYDVVPVYVTKEGEMYTGENFLNIDTYKNIDELKKTAHPIALVNEGGKVFVKYLDNKMFKKNAPKEINVAFPIVHGTNCEDGSIAGFCETLRVPYVGCDVLSAAIGMDKAKFKTVLAAAGLPVLPCVLFGIKKWANEKEKVIYDIENKIGYPVIVKPVNLGSSVGITKAENLAELTDAVNLAVSFAGEILVEKAVTSLREINCSVLGDCDGAEASVLEEPIMSGKILSYSDKYMSGGSKSGKTGSSKGMASLGRELPAKLSAEKTAEIQDIAKKTFLAMGASGVCRIDFLLDTADNDKVYVNEANTIPGSLSFYLWEAGGVKYPELINRLISLAFKRDRKRADLMFTINTNILDKTSFGTKGAKGSKI